MTIASRGIPLAEREDIEAAYERARHRVKQGTATLMTKMAENIERMSEDTDPWNVSDPWDNAQGNDSLFRSRIGSLVTSIENRKGERYEPYYYTEIELSRKRASNRVIAAFSEIGFGILDRLNDYTLSEGATFTCEPRNKGRADDLAKLCTSLIEKCLEFNDFKGEFDRDWGTRSRADGDVFVALHPDRREKNVLLDVLEPEMVREPPSTQALELWLSDMDRSYNPELPSEWSYGVHRQWNPRIRRMDNRRPLGYFVEYDESGRDWDYFDSSRMVHQKKNIPTNAPRGVSDFEPVWPEMQDEDKLGRNIARGAALQAAIAWIREHPEDSLPETLEEFVAGQAVKQITDREGTARRVENHPDGEIIDVPHGMSHQYGPVGQLGHPVWIEVAQYMLRKVGVRWGAPEYIISGDASNSNLASHLVSEHPFVKGREADQAAYRIAYIKMAWRILKIFHSLGMIPGIEDFEVIKRLVRIVVEFPEVGSRDMAAVAASNEVLHRNGILSKQTWAAQANLDYETEKQGLQDDPFVPPQPVGLPMTESGRREAAQKLLWEGYP